MLNLSQFWEDIILSVWKVKIKNGDHFHKYYMYKEYKNESKHGPLETQEMGSGAKKE